MSDQSVILINLLKVKPGGPLITGRKDRKIR
jgi:hypothetical protein